MKTKQTKPADAGSLSAIEQKHIHSLRALSARRNRAVIVFTENLLQREIENGTARPEATKAEKQSPIASFNAALRIIAAEEKRKAGKHLRLVVDNTLVTP